MKIIADANIPFTDEFFSSMGEVRRLPGRSIRAGDLADADILLVRSVTRVDDRLLGESRLRFIGSATIGTDHVDFAALARRGIPFGAAPGCNAVAVAEYVATALTLYADSAAEPLETLRMGVVGCGNVGRRVAAIGGVLGMQVAVCDPFIDVSALPSGTCLMGLDELMGWADVITLHVPLTRDGSAPTHHLLDRRRLQSGRWRLLLNTSRGPVVDNAALADLLASNTGRKVLLDVWESEPVVYGALLARTWLGTPHIAGYSAEGKWRGTAQVYRAACEALGLPALNSLDAIQSARRDTPREIAWPGSVSRLLTTCCRIPEDDHRLRSSVGPEGFVSAGVFDALRREYPERREFSHYRITGLPERRSAPETKTPQVNAASRELLAGLGFGLAD